VKAWPAPHVLTAASAAASCASLASLVLSKATVTSATEVTAGTFVPPGTTGADTGTYASLPAFCRVTATLTPTTDSDIRVEVWLPVSGWNGRFQGVGNGGWAGTISYGALASAVARGYAGASTDTGHSTNGAAFSLGHPEKLVDFAHRAVHEMTVQGKAIAQAFYERAPELSIWNGCSTGGRQGLAEASQYPADYDAIIAGATPDPWPRLAGIRVGVNRMVHRIAGSYIPPGKYRVLNDAVIKACDALDGVTDGVLEEPTACRFDPAVLECADGEGPSCLTRPQVETAKALYAPVTNPATGATLYPALLQPGSELQWGTLAGPEPYQIAVEAVRYVAFKNPDWDWRTFNPANDIALMDNAGAVLNTATPNLTPFFSRGGRLLMYHGWNDQQVPALSSVDFFNRVISALGSGVVGKSIQLYMVPGMNHCQGGVGTDTFDKVGAIEGWIAKGSAPAEIVAARSRNGKTDRTRPLCPYPQVARYKGSGSTDDAASFTCANPDR